MGIDWPVQSPAGCAHALLSFQEGKLTFSTHGCIKREATFRLRPRSRGLWRQKEAINPVPTIIWELSRTFLVENYWFEFWRKSMFSGPSITLSMATRGRILDLFIQGRTVEIWRDEPPNLLRLWSKIHILFLRAYAWNNEIFSVYWESATMCAERSASELRPLRIVDLIWSEIEWPSHLSSPLIHPAVRARTAD